MLWSNETDPFFFYYYCCCYCWHNLVISWLYINRYKKGRRNLTIRSESNQSIHNTVGTCYHLSHIDFYVWISICNFHKRFLLLAVSWNNLLKSRSQIKLPDDRICTQVSVTGTIKASLAGLHVGVSLLPFFFFFFF